MAVSVQCIKALFRKIYVFARSGRICLSWAYLLKEAYLLEVGLSYLSRSVSQTNPRGTLKQINILLQFSARENNRFYNFLISSEADTFLGDIF